MILSSLSRCVRQTGHLRRLGSDSVHSARAQSSQRQRWLHGSHAVLHGSVRQTTHSSVVSTSREPMAVPAGLFARSEVGDNGDVAAGEEFVEAVTFLPPMP